MTAVDTNLLVFAHREDSSWHAAAYSRIRELAEGREPWSIPWPCIHEFLAIVTHPRVYAPPSPLERAIDQVNAWLESPTLVLLAETANHWAHLRTFLEIGKISGPQVQDARVASLCRAHGISELWTADRDFSRFPGIRTKNPLVG